MLTCTQSVYSGNQSNALQIHEKQVKTTNIAKITASTIKIPFNTFIQTPFIIKTLLSLDYHLKPIYQDEVH